MRGFGVMTESVNISQYLLTLSFIVAATVLHSKQIQILKVYNSIRFALDSMSCLYASKLA